MWFWLCYSEIGKRIALLCNILGKTAFNNFVGAFKIILNLTREILNTASKETEISLYRLLKRDIMKGFIEHYLGIP